MPATVSIDPPNPAETRARLEEVTACLRSARRVQVIGHVRPDGDCIGSLIAAHHILADFGIEHALAAPELGAAMYREIPGYELIDERPRPDFEPDVTLFVDTADLTRSFKDWKATGRIVNVDHHGANSRFGEINWIEPECAAVGEMLFYLAEHSGAPLTGDLATALYLAILTDTGSFRYSSVRPRHLTLAGRLLEAGADHALVTAAVYDNRSPAAVELTGRIYSSLKYRRGGALVWGEARHELLERVGGAGQMPENLAGDLRSVRGVRLAILFVEPGPSGLRASLRGARGVDVSLLAAEFGGGGHPAASGITIEEGDYEKTRDRIVARAEQWLAGAEA